MTDFRVYVSNLPWSATEHELALLFDERMGPCVSLVTIGRHKTGASRGFAFVSFTNQQFCDRALAESEKLVLDGRILRVGMPSANLLPSSCFLTLPRCY